MPDPDYQNRSDLKVLSTTVAQTLLEGEKERCLREYHRLCDEKIRGLGYRILDDADDEQ